jgi:hypothetical protein
MHHRMIIWVMPVGIIRPAGVSWIVGRIPGRIPPGIVPGIVRAVHDREPGVIVGEGQIIIRWGIVSFKLLCLGNNCVFNRSAFVIGAFLGHQLCVTTPEEHQHCRQGNAGKENLYLWSHVMALPG